MCIQSEDMGCHWVEPDCRVMNGRGHCRGQGSPHDGKEPEQLGVSTVQSARLADPAEATTNSEVKCPWAVMSPVEDLDSLGTCGNGNPTKLRLLLSQHPMAYVRRRTVEVKRRYLKYLIPAMSHNSGSHHSCQPNTMIEWNSIEQTLWGMLNGKSTSRADTPRSPVQTGAEPALRGHYLL